MRLFASLTMAAAVLAGSAVAAEAVVPADAPVMVPAVMVPAAAPSGCHVSISGRTASGYCETVPAGDWYYLLGVCVDKAGHAYAVYSLRSYRGWLLVFVSCSYPYWFSSAQIVRST